VILARESGLSLELSDIQIEGLIPQSMAGISVDEFMARVSELNCALEKPLQAAKAKSEVLKYVGRIDNQGKASVRLASYPANHPFAQISATDNIVAFRTSRYDSQPLYVRGPGAGREVTAAGVFADLLRLCSYLGATL
jgi:aspartokinase/homoserine dehydrogenase 1